MGALLYVIHHSPWSERARWALDHHHVAFEEREHVPLIGELALRSRAGKWGGNVSVPLFIEPATHTTIQGSTAIATHADTTTPHPGAARLFPPDSAATIDALEPVVEDVLDAARARFVHELGADREACKESLPSWMRVLPFSAASARLGAWFVARKYSASFDGVNDRIRAGLETVRDVLGGREHVLPGGFSYADILAASGVQAIVPIPDPFLPLPPGTRRVWHHAALAREFADLVAWRDALYEKHRPTKQGQIA